MYIFKENLCILTNISLQFISKGQVNNKSSLVLVIARRPTDDKLTLPETSNDTFYRRIYKSPGFTELTRAALHTY